MIKSILHSKESLRRNMWHLCFCFFFPSLLFHSLRHFRVVGLMQFDSKLLCHPAKLFFFFFLSLSLTQTESLSLCLDLFAHPLYLSIFCTQYLLFCSADAINTLPLSGRYSKWHICYQQHLSGQKHKNLLRIQLKLVTNWVASFTLCVKKNKYKIVTFLSILLRSEIHDPEFEFNFYSSTSK